MTHSKAFTWILLTFISAVIHSADGVMIGQCVEPSTFPPQPTLLDVSKPFLEAGVPPRNQPEEQSHVGANSFNNPGMKAGYSS